MSDIKINFFDIIKPCMICQSNIPLIPVELKCFNCIRDGKCNYRVCLECAREYILINLPKLKRIRHFDDGRTTTQVKCLICPNKINSEMLTSFTSYRIDWHLINIIDLYFKENFTCDKCNDFKGNQKEIYKHIKQSCFKRIIKCDWCFYFIKFDEKNSHLLKCKKAPKCTWCKNIILDPSHTEECPDKMIWCSLCSQNIIAKKFQEHTNNHFENVDVDYKKVLNIFKEKEEYRPESV